ncbi:FtsX-like permease family protein [Brevibacillus sp. LEMMJ03]|uniref:FtsX-like permease family protein n=1 Tax=Brevibacillus sp. LEMMJ03 TaxID=2595056 RepID=UPI00118162DA|nr:FtsX-like permease family protein [Brevibacillus sp. LEMMJ03]TRY23579.1 FtsX-like permease family protein [Brevibacillus sp. LEMMJ03]
MIRFIWTQWWRHPERFLLLLVGMLAVSSVLSYFIGVTESSSGTTQDILQKRWKAAYHLVVRPPDTRSVTERDGLLEPNYLSGLHGGISLADYEAIKRMPEVEVAAPLAPVGYDTTVFWFGKISKPEQPGIYRHVVEVYADDGVQPNLMMQQTRYYTVGPWGMPTDWEQALRDYGVETWILDMGGGINPLLVVGIDPQAEAALVGLDQAVLPIGKSRYFTEQDKVTTIDAGDGRKVMNVPILMSSRMDSDLQVIYRYERLDLPFATSEDANRTMEEVKKNGGVSYLHQQKSAGERLEYVFDSRQMHQLILASLSGVDPETGKPFSRYDHGGQSAALAGLFLEKPSSLSLRKVSSPYPERWPYGYEAIPVQPNIPAELQTYFLLMKPERYPNSFRSTQFFVDWKNKDITPYWIGFYDPEKLRISKEPDSELPMETYRPATGRLVLDKDDKPLNPPVQVKPTNNPFGLLTSPPLLLTTLEAAAELLGDKPIAAIRLKVKGVQEVSEENREKLELLAREIENKTGLIVDITLGSSPQPVLVHIPKNGTYDELGWMEQFFIKLGTAFTLVQETKLGFSGVIGIVMLVAVAYVFATNLVTLYARIDEFGLLLAVGWRPGRVAGMMFVEAALLGGGAALVSWAIAGFAVWQQQAAVPVWRILFIGLCGLVIYVLAAIPAAWLVRKIPPHVIMRYGEMRPVTRRTVRVKGTFSLALGHLLARYRRCLLSVFAMAVPTCFLVFYEFVTNRLQGVLYTSWLGQYVAVEIGDAHYIAMILALALAVLTTAEIMWQNVMERKAELLLLKAVGWRSGAIFRLIVWEGVMCGLLASGCGLALGYALIAWMYRQLPGLDVLWLMGVGLIPILAAVLGALFPAVMAIRLRPAAGIRGSQRNRQRTERKLQLTIAVLLVSSLLGAAAGTTRLWQMYPRQEADTSISAYVPNQSTGDSAKERPGKVGDLAGFDPRPVPDGSKGTYQLAFHMDQSGKFTAEATIVVENRSPDTWDRLLFYFIPNAFTNANKPHTVKDAADVKIVSLHLDQQKTDYQLTHDTLTIPLTEGMAPGEKREVRISYTFTVPKDGIRFARKGHRYYLAQAYPMLATYHNGWNKQDFRISSESYHTGHADFTVSYHIPTGYLFVSSSDQDPVEATETGQVTISRVREVFAAVVNGLTCVSDTVSGVQIRVFGEEVNRGKMEAALATAREAVPFFINKIGSYPHRQLDIMLDDGASMEYPGIVTVAPQDDLASLRKTVVHEIVHQWFYAVVANDPYHEGWLDEGITEFAVSLFFLGHDKMTEEEVFAQANRAAVIAGEKPSNLPLDQYDGETYGAFYAVPSLRLWELVSTYGDVEEGWRFLRAYYERYSYQQVDTKEFIRFATTYFSVKETYFSSWLKLR